MVAINNSINNTVGASNSGVTNILTVTNPSNTASSAANTLITVGGGTAADPSLTYTVSGVTSWSMGIDNSASDNFVLSASTALGTSDTLVIDTNGYATFNNVATSLELTLACRNSDTNAASNSRVVAAVVNTSAADAYLQVAIEAVSNYCWGIDNSDSDSLKICYNANAANGTPSGTVNIWTMTTAGERTLPLQPAFLAYLASSALNKTGNGTAYNLGTDALTEVFDQNSDFNTNGTFTAPVTGRYFLSCSAYVNGCTIATIATLVLNTSNRNYEDYRSRTASAADIQPNISVLADMDAGDTYTATITVFGEAGATDDIFGSTNANTQMSGYLAC